MRALIDSNILIDFLEGNEAASDELDKYDNATISRITWIEVFVGARSEAEARLREKLLAEFAVVELDARIARAAVQLRREMRLKLPDAIILASARVNQFLLVTRNHRDFSRKEPDIRIPY